MDRLEDPWILAFEAAQDLLHTNNYEAARELLTSTLGRGRSELGSRDRRILALRTLLVEACVRLNPDSDAKSMLAINLMLAATAEPPDHQVVFTEATRLANYAEEANDAHLAAAYYGLAASRLDMLDVEPTVRLTAYLDEAMAQEGTARPERSWRAYGRALDSLKEVQGLPTEFHVDTLTRHAFHLSRSRMFPEAAQAYELLADRKWELDPEDPSIAAVRLAAAHLWLKAGDGTRCLSCLDLYEAALGRSAPSLTIMMPAVRLRAKAMLGLGDYGGAIRQYSMALEAFSPLTSQATRDRVELLLGLAMASALGKRSGAVRNLVTDLTDAAAQLGPGGQRDVIEGLLLIAEQLLLQGDTENARICFAAVEALAQISASDATIPRIVARFNVALLEGAEPVARTARLCEVLDEALRSLGPADHLTLDILTALIGT